MRIPLLFSIAAIAAASLPSPALAWGKTGHRSVGAVADTHLSGLARAQIREILGVETLEEASTWPDEMRSNPDPFWQKTASPWHYVTVGGFAYDKAPPEGDALEALEFFRRMLRNPNVSREDRQLALRFIVHVVGDLHQPLHVGRPGDRGGNTVKVKWFGRDTNLHAVWDTALIDDMQYSFTELAARLNRHTSSADVIAWWTANPRDWISESARVRETIYPEETELSYEYVYKHTPMVELRLKQAGVRLAAYLNELFAEPRPVAGRQP
ncbi:MAG: S1/P1 nuclease [Sphingomonas sp.]|nr:S1/P1 nuclease [Sphingomonas sp.]